jgi:hypothetical protein
VRLRWGFAVVLLAACSSESSTPGSSRLTLNNPMWEKVNVEVSFTKRGSCEAGDFVSSKQVVMRKNKTESFDVPAGTIACWRHDRDPNNPKQGDWTGYTKAVPFPGEAISTDL